jgi:hypothetical protein
MTDLPASINRYGSVFGFVKSFDGGPPLHGHGAAILSSAVIIRGSPHEILQAE